MLLSQRIDFRAKIPLLIEQAYPSHRDAQIACCLELIAGNVPEPARINRQRLAQHKLHREIRNRRQTRMRMRSLKPPFRSLGNAFLTMQISQEVLEVRVPSNTPQSLLRSSFPH